MPMSIECVPAYGRDYKTKAEVLAAFEAGKDFQIAELGYGGRYVNKEDKPAGTPLCVRYDQLRKVVVIK